MNDIPAQLSPENVEDFCRRWKVKEFSIFGSVIRDDFGPESDLDILVELEPGHGLGLYDLVDMKDELVSITGREVDLVLKGGLRNPVRRREILANRQVLYAA